MVTWCGGQSGEIEMLSDTAVWFPNSKAPVPPRWVLTRDPSGQFERKAFFCTHQTTVPPQIVGWFVSRWQVKVTFQETSAHLGVNTQRQWSDKAIARTTQYILIGNADCRRLASYNTLGSFAV